IPAGRHEQRRVPVPLHQIEAEHVHIELLRLREVSDMQMDMSDPRAWCEAGPGLRMPAELLEQRLHVQWRGAHLQQSTRDRPSIPGTIAIDLDAIAVG